MDLNARKWGKRGRIDKRITGRDAACGVISYVLHFTLIRD